MITTLRLAAIFLFLAAIPLAANGTPSALTARPLNAEVHLTWDGVVGADSYKVRRSLSPSGPFSLIGTTAALNYLDTTVTNGTVYYYVVAAMQNGVQSADSNTASAAPLPFMMYEDSTGALRYSTYANQGQVSSVHTVPDFSGAGYMGGGVSIPFVPAVVTINAPTGGDDTSLIQNAVNQVAALPLQGNGFRGALLIKAGNYRVANTITINASGIVIRGEGQGAGGTKITMTATVQDNLFEISGSGYYPSTSSPVTMADALVPSGSKSFNVTSASGYSAGNEIRIVYTMNQQWINAIGMNNIYDSTEARDESWTPSEFQLTYDRKVTAVSGNTIHIDNPLVQAIETQYGGATVTRLGTSSGRISKVGIEALKLESTYLNDNDEAHGWIAIRLGDTENAWVRQVTAKYFGLGCVNVSARCRNITIEDSAMVDPKSITDGGRKYSFNINDCSSVLVQRCYTWGGRHDYVSGSITPGPNAFVDSLSENAKSDVGPHFRYATGELYDNIKSAEINVQNRWDWGTGHGWSGAQVMFWNCVANKLACVTPTGAMNWAIGCVGSKVKGRISTEPYGIWESHYYHVAPRSIYYRQLQERLGATVLKDVIVPQQTTGPIWTALASWAGEGLFLDPLVVWSDSLVRPLSNTASLKGVVRDLKMLERGITATWSKVSGPGTVTFGNASSLATTASFSAQGTYVLRLLVNDGNTQRSADVTIMALTAANQVPVANAQSVSLDAGTARSIMLSGYDWDNEPIAYTIQTSPTNGTLSGTAPNLTYTPNSGYSGADSFTFTVSDGTNQSSPATVSITVAGIGLNLVAHWKLDETTDTVADDAIAPDGSPNEHDGTLVNMTGNEWDGAGALTLDGVNDHIVATGYKGVTGTAARTVSAWIKTTTDGAIVAWGTEVTSQKYIFRIETGQLRIEVDGGFLKSTSLVNDENWHHVAVVLPSGATNVTQHLFYIDGVSAATYTPISKAVSTASGIDVLIGNDHSSRYFKGMLDDVRIFNRALTAAEIGVLGGARPMPIAASGRVGFVAAGFSQSEGHADSSTVTLAVERTGSSEGAVSVNYATSNGTATVADADYTAASGTLNWASGESGSKTFTVTIAGDTKVETDETINLTLTNFISALPGSVTQATITILDDDLPTVQIVASDNAASEAGPDAGVWTISRIGHTNANLSVPFTLGGTATLGSDYQLSNNSPVVIPAGQSSVNVTLTPIDDSVRYEDAETAVLNLSSSANYALANNSATITIAENDVNNLPVVNAGANQIVALTTTGLWTPATLPPAAWYDAADSATITHTSGAVSQWNDKSGNNNHATQATSTVRPTTGSATLGGLNAVAFRLGDGTNKQFLAAPNHATLNLDPSGGANVFAVMKYLGFSNNGSTSVNAAVCKGQLLSASAAYGIRVGSSNQLGYQAGSNSQASTSNFSNQEILFSGTGDFAGNTSRIYVDGLLKTTVNPSGAFTSDNTDLLYIGRDNSSGRHANVDFGEILILGGVISEANRQKIEGYLAHKWNLYSKLASGHPYKNTAPQSYVIASNLAGTATDADGETLTLAWSVLSGPAGGVTIASTASLTSAVTFATPGTYVLRLTANDGLGTTTSDVTFTVLTATPFHFWGASNNITTADPNADSDGDGYNNLQEYAFGMNPASGGGTLAYTPGGAVTSTGPPIALNAAPAGVDFRAVFARRKNHAAAGLSYTVQFSADLTQWVNNDTTPTVLTGNDTANPSDVEVVSVPYPLFIPVSGGYKKPVFYRVAVATVGF